MKRGRPRRRYRRYRSKYLRNGVLAVAVLAAASIFADRSGLSDFARDRGFVAFSTPSGSPANGTEFSGRVTRIVDGDTFWISGQDVRIRIWGLDAPETNEPGGAAATAELTRLIAGQTLNCRQRDIDRFGRIVGQCFLPNGRDITREMISSGTAREFCRFSRNYYGTC